MCVGKSWRVRWSIRQLCCSGVLVATKRTLALVTASQIPTRRSELRVLPIELPMTRFPNGIATLKNRTLSPVARLFIDTAREVARPLAKKT